MNTLKWPLYLLRWDWSGHQQTCSRCSWLHFREYENREDPTLDRQTLIPSRLVHLGPPVAWKQFLHWLYHHRPQCLRWLSKEDSRNEIIYYLLSLNISYLSIPNQQSPKSERRKSTPNVTLFSQWGWSINWIIWRDVFLFIRILFPQVHLKLSVVDQWSDIFK